MVLSNQSSMTHDNDAWNDRAKALTKKIKASILDEGPMPFSHYMQQCLYEPELGYYQSRHKPMVGSQGDFITAPEISPLFSHCLARQWLDIEKNMTCCNILEIGAGTGRMASDIIHYCKAHHKPPKTYSILETSPLLQSEQHRLIKNEHPDYIQNVRWLRQWPQDFSGLIVGNEVLDAMPVERIEYRDGWKRQYVTLDGNQQLCYDYQEDQVISNHEGLNAIPTIPHYQTELSLIIPAWIRSASQALKQGLILLIDYGYSEHELYHPERSSGTLMCHYRHQTNQDPLWQPGCQDITAHVNFTQVAQAGLEHQLRFAGYCHQAAFLMNLGITDMVQADHSHQAYQTSQAMKQLLMPQEMGEKFKVLGLAKDLEQNFQGFLQLDQRDHLFKKNK